MFLGREKELSSLKELLEKSTASLVSCRGRRRIGKSTLFREFAKRNGVSFLVIEGLGPRKGQTNRDQLRNFGERLCAQTKGGHVVPESWMDAFRLLGERLDDTRKAIVLLDEISWMGRHEPDFPGFLKNGWDDILKHHNNLILVLCGSVSSWIQENLLESATFGGRFSRSIVLKELPLDECVKFWRGKEKRLAPREIIDVLAVTGGVPRYLEEISSSLSAEENIRRLCFREDGPLFQDFNAIFNETFGQTSLAKADILRALCQSPATCQEIAERLGVKRGGGLSRNLMELSEAGFIAEDVNMNPATGKKARISTYRVCDNYTRFYLRYIEPHIEAIRNGHYVFDALTCLPEWPAIMGLQFENLVVNNAALLRPLLHLDGRPIDSAAPYVLRGHEGQTGVQIDLLIQAGRSIFVVEIKRRNRIDAEVVQELEAKVKALPHRRGISIRTVLVYDGELAPGVLSSGAIDFPIPFTQLMGLPGSLPAPR